MTVMSPTIDWNYDRAEIRADGAVHVTGVSLALVGAWVIVGIALWHASVTTVFGASVYALCLIATLSLSALYNMWPVGPRKWLLRRFDHAGIFLLIAGTYTPFTLRMGPVGDLFLLWVWSVALLGMALKLLLAGRYDRLATFFYLALGWSGLAMSGIMIESLSPWTLGLIFLGGVAYTVGVIFHLWEKLRFQNAIWHGFVLVGAATHYGAVLITVLAVTRT